MQSPALIKVRKKRFAMSVLYDMHTHTDNSHDARQTAAQLCTAAAAAGLAGVAITDHGDSPYIEKRDNRHTIARSAAQATEQAALWAGRLEVLRGVEIGEECWAPEGAAVLHSLADFDVILASIHGFWRDGAVRYYSQEPFDAAHYTDEQLLDFLRGYLVAVGENAAVADYDVLAHLDCPLRYINGKYQRGVDILRLAPLIDQVLATVIRRDKTLEVNTSGLGLPWGQRMPQDAILRRYAALGGRRVCLGSDAHASANLAVGFADSAAFVRGLGFAAQTIYRQRQPCALPL